MTYTVKYEASTAKPRSWLVLEDRGEEAMEYMAREILENPKVRTAREVARTGTLMDQGVVESELSEAGFSLLDK